MAQIKIYTGQLIEITEPEKEIHKISKEDLAICLDRVIRFNGQHPGQISVAEHSLNTAAFAAHFNESNRMQLICLLHDAAEIILSDIPSPVKKQLGKEFFELEERWEMAMYKQYGATRGCIWSEHITRLFPSPTSQELLTMKTYDNMAYTYEMGLWACQYNWNFEVDTVSYVDLFLSKLNELTMSNQ